ncbi:MAG: hypothetical protein HN350_21660, partial [Phycisphaerales bacterium]|nr:hypothetical protein [Phycisphaerales bacterium]
MRDDDVIGIVQVTSQMWDGTEDGNWGNPNWLLGGVGTPVVPEAGMAMVVDSGKVTVAATPTATPLSLGVATTGTVEIAPAATLALTETVTVGDGGRLNVNGLLTTG